VKRLALGLALAAALPAGAACPPAVADGALLGDGPVQLRWRAEPQAISVGQPFALRLTLCPSTAKLLAVDASMPEHRHGMNYRPTVQALGEGRWRVEGLLWHMSGRWELVFEVQQGQGGRAERLRQSVVLP